MIKYMLSLVLILGVTFCTNPPREELMKIDSNIASSVRNNFIDFIHPFLVYNPNSSAHPNYYDIT